MTSPALLAAAALAAAGEPAPAPSAPAAAAGKPAPAPAAPAIDRPPELVEFSRADYPPGAREQRREADVLLEIDVGADGSVLGARVVEPAGHGFDEAALAAARGFRFRPAEAGGAPVPVRLRYRYRFRLEPEPASAPPPAAGTPAEPPPEPGGAPEPGPAPPAAPGAAPGEGDVFEVRARRERPEAVRVSVEREEMRLLPGTMGDAIKVVHSLPGVARPPFSGGLIVVRGSAPEDTNVYFDGMQAPELYHFGGLSSVINADLLRALDYHPGNFPVDYGRAIGGVIDARTRDGRGDGWHGYADVDLIDTSLLLEGPLARDLTVIAAARRSYIDALLGALLPEDAGVTLVAAPVYYDYQLKLAFTPSRRHEVRALVYGAADRLAFAIDDPADLDAELRSGEVSARQQFHRVQVEWTHAPGARFDHTLAAAAGAHTADFALGEDLFFHGRFAPVAVRDTARVRLARRARLRLGLDAQWIPADLRIRLPRPPKEGDVPVGLGEVVAFDRTVQTWMPGAFADVAVEPIDGLRVTPGVRGDYHSVTGSAWADPRVTVRQQLVRQLALRAGLGLFHQPPTPDETAEGFGNPDLGPERAVHGSLGVEASPREPIDVEATGFYKRMDRLVARSDRVVERGGERVPEVYANLGRGRAYGLELLVRHRPARRLFGWIAYTLSRSERRDPGGADWRPFDFDQTHVLTALASVALGRKWRAGARVRYATGNPETPIAGAVYDADADVYRRVPGARNSARHPDFLALDLRLDRRFRFDAWRLDVYLDVQNATNHANVETRAYSYDFSESAPVTGLPILPSFGIRGAF